MTMLRAFFFVILAASASGAAMTGTVGVVNKGDATASIIHLATGKTETFKVGYLPHEIVFGNGIAVVSNYGSAHIRSSSLSNRPGNTLSVIALAEPRAVSEIDMGPARCAPHGMAVSKNGHHLFVTCEAGYAIAEVDLPTRRIARMLATNQAGTHLVAVSSDESRLYAVNFFHGTVSVIDLKSGGLIKQIAVGRSCEGLSLSEDDRSLFVTIDETDEVVRIDTRSLEVAQRRALDKGSEPIRIIPIPSNPAQVLVNTDRADAMLLLNSDDLSVIRKIKVGRQNIGIAASADYGFSSNMNDDTISVVDLRTGKIEKTIPTGHVPDGMAFQP